MGWSWTKNQAGGLVLTEDSHHASAAGRYLGALVFYESLYGESAVGCTFRPEGVSADRAYSVAADKLEKLLNIQHGIVAHQSHRHAGPGGGPIPIALIEATLTAEEIETLAYLTGKLEAAAAEQ